MPRRITLGPFSRRTRHDRTQILHPLKHIHVRQLFQLPDAPPISHHHLFVIEQHPPLIPVHVHRIHRARQQYVRDVVPRMHARPLVRDERLESVRRRKRRRTRTTRRLFRRCRGARGDRHLTVVVGMIKQPLDCAFSIPVLRATSTIMVHIHGGLRTVSNSAFRACACVNPMSASNAI